MGESGDIVGMVDVLKLTYATLDQVTRTSILCPHCSAKFNLDQLHVNRRQRRSRLG